MDLDLATQAKNMWTQIIVMVQKWPYKRKNYVPLRANFTTYIQISPTSETGEDI